MPERVTRQLLAVLEVFMADPTREWYGLELMDAASLKSGTLYPLLHRLTTDGWLVRTRDVPSTAGGPGRCLYRLTAAGEGAAAPLLDPHKMRAPARVLGRIEPGIAPA
jgi:DNA-binding PadR family transcriptional regulator